MQVVIKKGIVANKMVKVVIMKAKKMYYWLAGCESTVKMMEPLPGFCFAFLAGKVPTYDP